MPRSTGSARTASREPDRRLVLASVDDPWATVGGEGPLAPAAVHSGVLVFGVSEYPVVPAALKAYRLPSIEPMQTPVGYCRREKI